MYKVDAFIHIVEKISHCKQEQQQKSHFKEKNNVFIHITAKIS